MRRENKVWKGVAIFVGLLLIVALGTLFYMSSKEPVAIAPQVSVTPAGGVAGCDYTPAITYAGFDQYLQGTAVGVTAYTQVDSNPFKTGVTGANPGQSLKILLVNDTTYHNVVIDNTAVTCVPTLPISNGLKKNASITVSMYNTDGDKLTDGGGATNQTVATGGTYNLKIRLDGQDQASTNDMIAVLESTDKTKANTIILSGFGAVKQGEVPSFYTLSGTGSGTWVYTVAPVEGANSYEGIVQVQSKSGQSLAGTGVIVSFYTKENFLGANGKLGYGVEDLSASSSSPQYMATYSYTAYFT